MWVTPLVVLRKSIQHNACTFEKHRAQISPKAERSRSAGATVELGTELPFSTLVDGMRVETHFPVRPSISVEV